MVLSSSFLLLDCRLVFLLLPCCSPLCVVVVVGGAGTAAAASSVVSLLPVPRHPPPRGCRPQQARGAPGYSRRFLLLRSGRLMAARWVAGAAAAAQAVFPPCAVFGSSAAPGSCQLPTSSWRVMLPSSSRPRHAACALLNNNGSHVHTTISGPN